MNHYLANQIQDEIIEIVCNNLREHNFVFSICKYEVSFLEIVGGFSFYQF